MLKRLCTLAFALFALGACNDDKEDDGLPAGYRYAASNEQVADGVLLENLLFFGTSKVTTADGKAASFTDPKALFELAKTEAGQTVLSMHATRFAAAMPAVEMRMPGLSVTGSGKTLSLQAARVVPQNYVAAADQWVDNPRYVITDLAATMDDTHLTVSFTCAGTFQVRYSGKLIVQ